VFWNVLNVVYELFFQNHQLNVLSCPYFTEFGVGNVTRSDNLSIGDVFADDNLRDFFEKDLQKLLILFRSIRVHSFLSGLTSLFVNDQYLFELVNYFSLILVFVLSESPSQKLAEFVQIAYELNVFGRFAQLFRNWSFLRVLHGFFFQYQNRKINQRHLTFVFSVVNKIPILFLLWWFNGCLLI